MKQDPLPNETLRVCGHLRVARRTVSEATEGIFVALWDCRGYFHLL